MSKWTAKQVRVAAQILSEGGSISRASSESGMPRHVRDGGVRYSLRDFPPVAKALHRILAKQALVDPPPDTPGADPFDLDGKRYAAPTDRPVEPLADTGKVVSLDRRRRKRKAESPDPPPPGPSESAGPETPPFVEVLPPLPRDEVDCTEGGLLSKLELAFRVGLAGGNALAMTSAVIGQAKIVGALRAPRRHDDHPRVKRLLDMTSEELDYALSGQTDEAADGD